MGRARRTQPSTASPSTEFSGLSREIDGYADVISAAQQSIANSAGLRKTLRGRLNEVEACFDVLDRLIHHFAQTSKGRYLISAYQASRVIIDRGHRFNSPKPNSQPTPTNGAPTPCRSVFRRNLIRVGSAGRLSFNGSASQKIMPPIDFSISAAHSQPTRRPF